MSIMKGKLRRSAVVVAFSLGAFQALSIVGAQVASAAAGGDVHFRRRRRNGLGRTTVTRHGLRRTPTAGSTLATRRSARRADDTGRSARRRVQRSAGRTSPPRPPSTSRATAVRHQRPGRQHRDGDVHRGRRLDTTQVTANWGAINWTVNLGNNTRPPVTRSSVNNDNTNSNVPLGPTAGANGIDLNDRRRPRHDERQGGELRSTPRLAASNADTTSTWTARRSQVRPFPTGSTISDVERARWPERRTDLSGGAGNDTHHRWARRRLDPPGLGNDTHRLLLLARHAGLLETPRRRSTPTC